MSCVGGVQVHSNAGDIIGEKVKNSSLSSGDKYMLTFGGASVARLTKSNKILELCIFLFDEVWLL